MENFFNTQDAPLSKMAEVFCTIKGNRYSMFNAKKVDAKANVSTKEVPMLGRPIKGRKATGMEIKITMTVYKCTEYFDDMISEFKRTGVLPVFDIQTTNEDAATSMGRSTKIYNDCVIDGDVLLSLAEADGDYIEQEITAYASDFSSPEKYTAPEYM